MPPDPAFVWTIIPGTGGQVDLINAFWVGTGGTTNPDGDDQSVDIDVESAIEQAVATSPGSTYDLRLYYARNVAATSSTGYVTVTGASTLVSETLVHSVTPISATSMQWTLFSRQFVADSASTTLSIQGDIANGTLGFAVDDVSLELVPPPPVCGNGSVEGVEDCDDGSTEDGDCCSATCTFEAVGSVCSDADACTTGDTCDGAGACSPGAPVTSAVGMLSPTPYLCFDDSTVPGCAGAQSPFTCIDFSAGFFRLEDFEDQQLDTPGASAVSGGNPSPNDDSVAADDDGDLSDDPDAPDFILAAAAGTSYDQFEGQATVLTITFNEATFGRLPTHVGIVATDTTGGDTVFEAYGPGSVFLGGFGPPDTIDFGPGPNDGTARRDRFLGFIDAGGIAEIRVYCSPLDASCNSQWDHLQFGDPTAALVPALSPTSGAALFALLLSIGGFVAWYETRVRASTR